MAKIEVLLTKDGSHTVYNREIDESYHAYNGAVTESEHVYIENGLKYHLLSAEGTGQKPVRILEFGFGTGLNTILTIIASRKLNLEIEYTTAEPFPLPPEIVNDLNYAELFASTAADYFERIHAAAWDQDVRLNPVFTLRKARSKIEDLPLSNEPYDIIYYDAFAPGKQPDAWKIDVLKKCRALLRQGGLLVTYCANGQFKRNLKSLGFELNQTEGPTGRKEMTRARKI